LNILQKSGVGGSPPAPLAPTALMSTDKIYD
jgi:hypothetical protein